LAYNRELSDKFLIGLHGDIILSDFLVEKSDNEFAERDVPVSLLLVGTYKVVSRLGIEFGAGVEFSKEENLEMAKIGLEYSHPITNGFEILANFGYDFIFETYNSYNIGLGVGRRF